MKIAVDIRPLSHTITGIGRYTLSVLSRMMQGSAHQWFLYSDAPLADEIALPSPYVFRAPKVKPPLSSSLLAQTLFPCWAMRDRVELFWSPRHHLPLFMPRKIKCIVTIHDVVWVRHPETMTHGGRLLEQLLMRPSIRVADGVICVSDFTRRELKAIFSVAESKILVTPLAATAPPTNGTAALPRQLQGASYVLFVGTLEPRKNLQGLIQAFAELPARYSNYRLVIAGQDGWLQQPLKNMLDKYGIADRCLLMGYVDEALLHCLYQQAAALAMPSLYEGYGLPALEAMQYGIPVVVGSESEIAGLNSSLVYVCQNTGAAAILSALTRAIEAGKGRPWAMNSWQDTAQKTLELIESI